MSAETYNNGFVKRIDSQKHPIIEKLRELQTEKGRVAHSEFHVEGPMLVGRALDYAVGVSAVLRTDRFASSPGSEELLTPALESGIPIYQITEGLMSKVVPGKPPPGVVAIVSRQLHEPDAMLAGASPFLMLVDRCENPDNLGMLLRSLDAAGVDGVVFTSDCVDPFSRLSVRASRGSVLSLRMSIVDDPEGWLLDARDRGFRIVASSAHGSENIWTVNFTSPTIMVVGNEHTGVRKSIVELADVLTLIPMSGRMESLNIAVAGAIIAYEAARQRQKP